jgi:hypothetical protein
MKTTDWKWGGSILGVKVRRHGHWCIGRPSGWFHFVHYGPTTGQWRLKIGSSWLAWFPKDPVRLAVDIWRYHR